MVDVDQAFKDVVPNLEGRYECKFCDVTLAHKSDLKTHLNKHSNKFRCDICDVNCTRQVILDNHLAGEKHRRKLSETQFRKDSPANKLTPFSIESLLNSSSPSIHPAIDTSYEQPKSFRGFPQTPTPPTPPRPSRPCPPATSHVDPPGPPSRPSPPGPPRVYPPGPSHHARPPGPHPPSPPHPIPPPPLRPEPNQTQAEKRYYEQNNPFRNQPPKAPVKNSDILQDALNFAFCDTEPVQQRELRGPVIPKEPVVPKEPELSKQPVQFSINFNPNYLTNVSQEGVRTQSVRNAKFESYLAQIKSGINPSIQHTRIQTPDPPRAAGARRPSRPFLNPAAKSSTKRSRRERRQYEKFWCTVCNRWLGGGKALVSRHLRAKHEYEDCDVVYITQRGMLKMSKEEFLPDEIQSNTSKEINDIKYEFDDSGIDLSFAL